uniref:amino acid adenylation domain-containing protein n=1 Tax=Shewanella sp. TaxID=50422 RepID=UPI004053EC43
MNINELITCLAKKDIDLYLDESGKLKAKAPSGALGSTEIALIKDNKSGLINYLQQLSRVSKAQEVQTIQAVERGDDNRMPLSFSQQRLWFINSLQGETSEYNIPAILNTNGYLDLALLNQVLNTIVARHEVLRTVYVEEQGNVLQQIKQVSEVTFSITEHDFSDLTSETQTKLVDEAVTQEVIKPFALSKDLMLRVSYLKTSARSGVLIFNMHHIASDGWSLEVLTKEFFALYEAYSEHKANPLAPLTIQYADYAQWQRDYLSSERLEQQLSYWQQQLDELPIVHSLPLDKPRPATKQYRGAVVTSQLDKTVSTKLMAMARQHQLTPFMLLHGALSLVLSRHSNSSDIVIGTPVANRLQAELEPLIGFFVNSLVLRVNTAQASLTEYFAHIKQVHLDAQSNQDVPFEQLVGRLNVPRNTAHSPVFQILLNTHTDYGLQGNTDVNALSLPGVDIKPYEQAYTQEKFDLSIDLSLHEQGVELSWRYDVSLFEQQHIAQINGHLCRLLTELADAQATQSPHSLDMLSQQEQQHLLYTLNDTARPYPQDKCIHELFMAQAAASPEQTALVFAGERLSYKALDEKSNQLAHYLQQAHNVGANTLVGLCFERSFEMVVSILAVLKAGGAYLPLDPSYPAGRLAYMVEDAQLKVVLTQDAVSQSLSDFTGSKVTLDGLLASEHVIAQQYGVEAVEHRGCADDLAYVIYTSGSTGQPKGVLLGHQALVNRINWMNEQYTLSSSDAVLQKTPYSFDVSVWEFLWPLAYGARLVIAKPEGHKEPEYLCDLIKQQQVTKLHFVPSMLETTLDTGALVACDSVKQVFCSGEALQLNHIQRFKEQLPSAELHNLYGPTEAAIDVSYWDCSGKVNQVVPIGKPISNIQLLILDDNLNLVPQGAQGELHIGGDGLAKGYLNRLDLTEQRFILNPYYDCAVPNSSLRFYKTGDLARFRKDGEIEYLGRTDHQVKIRGLRIELDEIEHQLGSHAEVASVLVSVFNMAGEDQLVGYVKTNRVISEQDTPAMISDIKQHLSTQLPDYMIPTFIIFITQWPLSNNGKVDRKSLPEPHSSLVLQKYEAPNSPTEMLLASVWSELLGLEETKVSCCANFFELGGHSLLIVKLRGALQQQGWEPQAKALFEHTSLADMASYLDELGQSQQFEIAENKILTSSTTISPDMLPLMELTQTDIDQLVARVPGGVANVQDIYPLTPLQEGLLFIHKMSSERDPYVLAFAVECATKQALDNLIAALEFIISRHDVLRTAIMEGEQHQPVQVVLRQAKLPIHYLSPEQLAYDKQAVLNYIETGAFSFALDIAPLTQLEVVQSDSASGSYVIVKIHHIISDHIALETIIDEIFACCKQETARLDQPCLYREFVARALHNMSSLDIAGYFSHKLAKVTEPTLPFGLSNILRDGSGNRTSRIELEQSKTKRIRQIMLARNSSPAIFFHAVWSLFLSASTNQSHVVFGTVMSGRMSGQLGIERAIGMMINTLPFVSSLDGMSSDSFVTAVHQGVHDLIPFEHVPLAEVQKYSAIGSDLPLFNSILNFRHSLGKEEVDTSVGLSLLGQFARTNYPMILSVSDFGDAHPFALDLVADESLPLGDILSFVSEISLNLITALENSHCVEDSIFEAIPDNHLRAQFIEQNLLVKSDWEKTLLDLPAVHELPLDFQRPNIKQHTGEALTTQLPTQTVELLNKQSAEQFTPLMAVHAALALVLARHSNSQNIVIGSPVHQVVSQVSTNTGHSKQANLILHVDTSKETVLDYVRHVTDVHHQAQKHICKSLANLAQKLGIEVDSAYQPIFQVMLSKDNKHDMNQAIGGLDLKLDLTYSEDGGEFTWLFDTSLFKVSRIECLNQHVITVLNALLRVEDNAVRELSGLEMLCEQEQQALLMLNNNHVEASAEQAIHHLFELHAAQTPKSIALSFSGVQITYQQVNEQANQLAHYLAANFGIESGKLVGVYLERSIEAIVAILAVLKTGAAYVPLELKLPQQRVAYIIDEAQPTVVLTQTHLQQMFSLLNVPTICLDELAQHSQLAVSNLNIKIGSSQPAYVIYTSGSTGKPKGVVQSHGTIVNLVHSGIVQEHIAKRYKTLQYTSFAFDVSIQEMATSWATGSELYVLSESEKQSLHQLPAVLLKQQIERVFMPPAVLQIV